MWRNAAQPKKPQMAIWRTRNACWVYKATDTHPKHEHLLPFHCKYGCSNAPQCDAMRHIAVLCLLTAPNAKHFFASMVDERNVIAED